MAKIDDLLKEYAAELETIYADETAVPNTFTGVLSCFARDILDMKEGSVFVHNGMIHTVAEIECHGVTPSGGHEEFTFYTSRASKDV